MLSEFKFTNAYRASDRTSQYLIRNVIYDRPRPFRDVFARVLLFKLFNRVETWRLLENAVGDIDAARIHDSELELVLGDAMRRGERIYSAAYIMPSAQHFGSDRKHVNHLRLLRVMLRDRADERIADSPGPADAYRILLGYPSIGPFIGYQIVTDLSYSPQLHFRENEFVAAGPGALDGLRKCFAEPGDLSAEDIIRWTMDTQIEQFAANGQEFDDLWGRPLQLIDCQNLFCEVDKYARVAHPEVAGLSGRTRIKQRYRPRPESPTAWYPPKWGINERIAAWLSE